MTKNPLGKLGGGKLAGRSVKVDSPESQVAETRQTTSKPPDRRLQPPSTVPGAEIVHGKRRRGSSDSVQQTVRLRREDWGVMNEIKVTTGMSSQEQFIKALAMWFDHNNKAPPQAP